MNLTSCSKCGVVLDLSRYEFVHPTEIYHEDGGINESVAMWHNSKWVPKIQCPVCHNDIPQSDD